MRAAYDTIYFELKHLIEEGVYPYRTFLPSESILVKRYGCAHNTVRKALAALSAEGYAQPIHGKGVRVIYQSLAQGPVATSTYTIKGIEPFKEGAERSGFVPSTKVIAMEEVVADESLSNHTHFEVGEHLVHLERVRHYDGKPQSRETNYFRKDIVEGITEEVAEDSVYRYIEDVRGNKVVICKRHITMEPANQTDYELLDMDGADYVAVLRVITFDDNGLICEYSQHRHHPDVFALDQTTIRTRISG